MPEFHCAMAALALAQVSGMPVGSVGGVHAGRHGGMGNVGLTQVFVGLPNIVKGDGDGCPHTRHGDNKSIKAPTLRRMVLAERRMVFSPNGG